MGRTYRILFFIYDWNNEVVYDYLQGVQNFLKRHPDTSVTIVEGFGRYGSSEADNGELQIFNLPRISNFDGVAIQGNSAWLPDQKQILVNRATRSGIPVISYNYYLNGATLIGSDNYSAMNDVVDFVMEKRHPRTLAFVAGPERSEEARDRKRAFLSNCRRHGIPDENIRLYPGSWAQESGVKAALQILEDGAVPDAVICANDDLAAGIVEIFKKNGIRVPEDVAVTGFDNILISKITEPRLATVDRNYVEAGENGLESLYKAMTGHIVDTVVYSPTKLIPGESCVDERDSNDLRALRRKFLRLSKATRDYYIARDTSGPLMDRAESISELMHIFEDEFAKMFVGSSYVVINKDYLDNFEGAESVRHYGENMYLMGIVNRNRPKPACNDRHIYRVFSRTELLPEEYREENQLMIYYPLRLDEICIGYIALEGTSPIMEFYFMEVIFKHMENAIEEIRKKFLLRTLNAKLNDLYVRDNLTGLFNRFGLARYGSTYMQELIRDHEDVYISFMDLDKMKTINDTFGHDMGDDALKRTADIIRSAIGSRGFLPIRYGGDEFVIISSESMVDTLKETIIRNKKEYPISYELDFSIGEYKHTPHDGKTLQELIDIADDLMYQNKKEKRAHGDMSRESK